MKDLLEKIFKLKANNTTISTELTAGTTTFVTMCYIIFVQPIILVAALHGQGDVDAFKAGVFAATCIASAIATFLMAFLANYPIALAPAMGHNVFFAYIVCGTGAGMFKFGWHAALGAVFISGCIFLALSFFGFREKLLNAIPRSIKNAIAVGIGLLIALVGLEYAGLVVPCSGTHIGLGPIASRGVLLALIGFGLMSVLIALKVRGAILIATLATAIIGMLPGFGIVSFPKLSDIASLPKMSYTIFALDIGGVFTSASGIAGAIIVIFVFFFLDLFDTVGTLVGVGERAGFMKEDGTLQGPERPLQRRCGDSHRGGAWHIHRHKLHRERGRRRLRRQDGACKYRDRAAVRARPVLLPDSADGRGLLRGASRRLHLPGDSAGAYHRRLNDDEKRAQN